MILSTVETTSPDHSVSHDRLTAIRPDKECSRYESPVSAKTCYKRNLMFSPVHDTEPTGSCKHRNLSKSCTPEKSVHFLSPPEIGELQEPPFGCLASIHPVNFPVFFNETCYENPAGFKHTIYVTENRNHQENR